MPTKVYINMVRFVESGKRMRKLPSIGYKLHYFIQVGLFHYIFVLTKCLPIFFLETLYTLKLQSKFKTSEQEGRKGKKNNGKYPSKVA